MYEHNYIYIYVYEYIYNDCALFQACLTSDGVLSGQF